MTPHDINNSPLPERVAVLESEIDTIKSVIKTLCGKEDGIMASVNLLTTSIGLLAQKVDSIMAERVVWKNPLVWTNLISLAITGLALYRK